MAMMDDGVVSDTAAPLRWPIDAARAPNRQHQLVLFTEDGAVRRLAGIPAVLINGCHDMPYPLKFAWQVHEAWSEAPFHLVESPGHSGREPGILELMLRAISHCAQIEAGNVAGQIHALVDAEITPVSAETR